MKQRCSLPPEGTWEYEHAIGTDARLGEAAEVFLIAGLHHDFRGVEDEGVIPRC